MRMKWKSLMLAFIVGIGMSSCSDDSKDPVIDIDGPDETTEVGYFALRIGADSSVGTKAQDIDGLEQERVINHVRLVYYNAKTMIAEYAFTYSGAGLHGTGQDFQGDKMLNVNDDDAKEILYDDPGYSSTASTFHFIPQAEEVQAKDYKLLVLVNPHADAIAQTKALNEGTPAANIENFRDFVVSITENDLTKFIGGKNAHDATHPAYFFMANFQELIDVPASKIKPTKLEAYKDKVIAKVDRAVAKVSMRAKVADVATASNAFVSDLSWKLDVTNKKSFWYRHMAPILGGTVDENPTVVTQRTDLYATDPNFDGYSYERYLFYKEPYGGTLTNKDDLKNTYFNYISKGIFDAAPAGDPNEMRDVATANWNNADYEYALENTMAAKEQFEDVTTAAIVKAKYTPKKSALETPMTEGTKYYVWEGYVFTAADLVAIRDFDPGTAVIDKEKFEMFVTLQNLLKAQKGGLDLEFGADFAEPTLTASSKASAAIPGLQLNADAVNYYRILIRHFNNIQEPTTMGYGRYGIVRNNWYRMTLTKLLGPGSINIPEPKGPDDKDKWNVAADIEVLPWVVRDQDAIGGGYY